MATNIAKIPSFALRDVKKALNEKYNGNEEKVNAEIESSSATELFEYYLHWNGVINYTDLFIAALDGFRAAKAK